LGIGGGCYNIPPDKREAFYDLYLEHLKSGRFEYLTEAQGDTSPLVVDLDFRYDSEVEERQHSEGVIQDLVALYTKALSSIVAFTEGTSIKAFAMEKPHVNCCEGQTKDGVHIVIATPLDRATQCLVRDHVRCDISDCIGELPLTNDVDSVLDEGISLGSTNWQLYGSRKPGNEAYAVTYTSCWVADADGVLQLSDVVATKSDDASLKALHQMMSVRAYCDGEFETPAIRDDSQAAHTAWVARLTKPAPTAMVPSMLNNTHALHGGSVIPSCIITTSMLADEISKAAIDHINALDSPDTYHLREVAQYTMCLGADYYDDRNKWLQVGLALNATHPELFGIWMAFSAMSAKFDTSQVNSHRETWDTMGKSAKTTGRRLTARSIMYWARTSNPDGYFAVNSKCVNHYMDETLKGATEYDVAQVMHCKFKDKYKCVSIKSRLWYEYDKHRWVECDSGHALRHRISAWLAVEYLKKTQEIVNQTLQSNGDSEESSALQKRASKYSEIALLLKKTNYKDHVMRECCELFYDPKFLDQLDTNPNILCFNNGIYDFEEQEFRAGRADDYVSLTTGTEYVPIKSVCSSMRAEVNEFMAQLFPDPELNDYMWDHLASVLPGMNENQTFNIYSGIGSNGKSKLVELMSLVLGDYKGTVPITMVVGNRTNIGSASPEIAQLKGKRYAVMQEPTKGDKINEGILKEMTGSDPIQGRHLYKDTVTYVPQFTLAVCCNDLPTFKSNDEGTWRRVRLCRFMACFVDADEAEDKKLENPNVVHWFPKNKKLGDRMKDWVPTFTSMLVERVKQTKGEVRTCEVVLRESKKYRNDQDVLVLFRQERLHEVSGEWLNITVAWQDFQDWYRESYPGRRSMPDRKELRASLERVMGVYKSHTRGWKNWSSAPAVDYAEDYAE
jgi:P4 family phage/plasmid primase-like protien